MSIQIHRILFLICAWLLTNAPIHAQSRNLTAAVLINSQNASGFNPSSTNPGEFQRFTERYLEHLQVPYVLFDVATVAPPADLNSRQLIIAGHDRLLLTAAWRNAIANAVNAGTGFVNLDSDVAIGNESHIATIFGATGSAAGTAATQISVPPAVAPGGASPHYIAALQKKFDDPSGNLTYPFHVDADGILRSATSTVLLNAQGTVIARLGNDPLILAKTSGAGRAVHFGTLDYLNADRFGFSMGVDDLFWRSLVWAARKPFVVRGYPRLWSVQMDDTQQGFGSRVGDLYNPNLTGQASADGTGGPWKVTGFLFTDNSSPGSGDRAQMIADINAGKLEVTPHSFGSVMCGNMYWNACSGALTDQAWQANMTAIDAWKQGNGGADTIPSFSRSFVAHFWNLSDNTGYDLWNHYGFRYMTSIQKPGFQSTSENNGAERLPARSFWNYRMPPKASVSSGYSTENFPFFFSDDYTVRSRSGLPAQTFFLFATQYFDFAKYDRPDFCWPNAWPTSQTVASSIAQLQQYTWRHWSSLGPVQLFTHDAINYENASASERQTVISQSSTWLNSNGVRHVFMDDLGDYIYARTKSKLTAATFNGTQLAYTFTGRAANADGNLISTQMLVFQGDTEGEWQTAPGFTNGLQLSRDLPPSIQSVTPPSGLPAGGTTVTISGTGFTSGSTVFFGQGSASGVTFVNSSTLQVVTPPGPIGSVDVRVITANGTATLPNGFSYIPPPPNCPCTGWNSSVTPVRIDSGDSAAAELGVKFRSDVSGYITSLRFYKSSANTGTHVGHLWSSSGTLLGSVTFANETGSGWQQADFSSPVAITAGTTYVASYFAPNGHYSVDLSYFASTGLDNYPLHLLKDGIDGANGIYTYSATSAFPTSTFQSSNYWVDVIFNTTPSSPGPTVSSFYPNSGATGISAATVVSATFSKALNPATVTSNTFQLKDSANNPVSATVTYNAATFTASLTPVSTLNLASTYTATVIGGSSGVKDTSGSPMASNVSWVFTTASQPPRVCPCTSWNSSTTPGLADSGNGAALELGVKFRSDVNGFITGLRFYKSSANTGTHVGHLWNSNGTLIATVTFTNETGSGWQQADFSSPVAITAGTTYVASYFAPNGHYSVDLGFFASTGLDNAPLHLLKDGVAGANGVFAEGAPVFPTSTFQSSNYWVDVVFDTVASTSGPTVTSFHPNSGATGASVATVVSATFSRALDPATITASTFRLLDSSSNTVLASVAYNASTLTATLTPASTLNLASSYTAVITGGSAGVKDASGNPMTSNVSWIFTTASQPPRVCPCTSWNSSATPGLVDSGNAAALELGVKFRSDVNGFITGLRFYKSSANTGTHVGHLWNNNGTLIATATFTNETASGWQQVEFSSPVAITAGTTYVASYFAPNGHYSVDLGFFASTGLDNAPLHLLKDGVAGANGVFAEGAPVFPTSTFQSSNYWVDVVFDTTASTPGPAVTSFYPAAGATGISAAVVVSANFNKALNPATVTGSTFQLRDSSSNPVAASVTYNATTFTATLTPVSALNLASSYTATVVGGATGVKDTAGNPMISNISWGFTTAADPPRVCPCTVWNTSATPGVVDSGNGNAFEVGVKFRSDVNGFITGLRFYKSLANTGTHVGHLWSGDGVLLASATFTNETGSGWQQVNFSASVAVTAGATYVASYFAPNGHYSVDLGFFASTGVDNAPLHLLKDGIAGSNGVFGEGAAVFPASTFQSSNYWVDVVFDTTAGPGATVALASLAVNPATVLGGSSSTGTATLTAAAPVSGATVLLSSDNAAASVPASVTIPSGATSGTFTISSAAVSSSTAVTISGSYQGQKTAVLTVSPPAVSSLTLNPISVISGSTSTGTITLNSPAPVAGAVVALSSTNASAATVPASITIASGATTGTFTVNTGTVSTATPVTISASLNGVATAVLTVNVNGVPISTLSLNPTTVLGGASSTATVTLIAAAPSGGVVVALSSNNPAAAVPASVTVLAGTTTRTFPVTTVGVPSNTTVTISGTSGGTTRNAGLTVTPPTLASVSLNPTTVVGGASSTGTVTLNGIAPSGGAVVTLSDTNSGASVPASVTIAAGATTATFTVTTVPVSTTRTGTVSGSYRGTTRTSGTLTVSRPALNTLTVNPNSVTGGSNSTGTVTLTGVAAVNTTVALSRNNSAATVPASVVVPAGASSANFTITTRSVFFNTNVTITATLNGVTRNATLTVRSFLLSSLTLNSPSVRGGTSSTGTITLDGPASGLTLVTLSSSSLLVAFAPLILFIPAGQTSATFTVTTNRVAGPRTVTISGTLGTTRSATLTVTP